MLRIGTLVPNTETPIGDGLTGAQRAVIRVEGRTQAAVIKRIAVEAVIAECFCGLLFKEWGLPTPEPILVRDGEAILFGSMDMGYPNLKRRLGWAPGLPSAQQRLLESASAAIVCTWSDAPLALAADEAISNADRNLGNFLWDGAEHAYIDHERTLGLIAQRRNLLAEIAILAGRADDVERASVTAALVIDTAAPHRIEMPEGVDFSVFVTHVEKQLQGLPSRVLNRFPRKEDLLTGLEPPP